MKKIIYFLLVACIGISIFISWHTVLAETQATNVEPVTLENNTLYANGNTLYLKRDKAGDIYAYDALNGGKILDDKLNNITTIYGGSKNKSILGDVNMTFDGVSMSSIYGGGYSDGSGVADVTGNVSINIIGTVNARTLYGGGYANGNIGNAQANVNGNVNVQVIAKPTTNHSYISGGGYAYATKVYTATANINGNITMEVVGRVERVYGGGRASSFPISNSGQATANVGGNVDLHLNGVDVRDVYCSGLAEGNATVHVQDVYALIDARSEVASLIGGVYTSNGGQGNARDVELEFINCSNLYGYIYGGGQAYSGSSSSVRNARITIKDSDLPAYEQMPGWGAVSAAVFGGGGANDENSKANTESTSLYVENCISAATYYSGGESTASSEANVGKANAYYADNVGSDFNGEVYTSTIIAGGSGDFFDTTNVSVSDITVVDGAIEGVWGGNENAGNSEAMLGTSHLYVPEELIVNTIVNFDAISIQNPLHTQALIGKASTIPTEIIVEDQMLVGTPLVYCDDIEAMEDIFTITNNKLDYAIKENKSIWSLGQMTYQIETSANVGGSVIPTKTVNKFDSMDITWEADDLYQIDKILFDGKELAIEGTTYTLNNIKSNHTFEVIFKKIPGVVNDVVEIPEKPDVPKATADLDKDLVENLLSDEDRVAIGDGKSIQFELSIDKASNVPDKAELSMEKVVDKENILLNLDINFLKNVGGDKTSITEVNTKIRIVMNIPDEFIKARQEQEFAILRTHLNEDGIYETEILKDLDDDPNTITFETDKFSLYSLIYDVPKAEIPTDPENPTDPNVDIQNPEQPQLPDDPIDHGQTTKPSVNTGDTTNMVTYLILFVSTGMLLIGLVALRKLQSREIF